MGSPAVGEDLGGGGRSVRGWGALVPASLIPFAFPSGGVMWGWGAGGRDQGPWSGPGAVSWSPTILLPTGGCAHCATRLRDISACPGLAVLVGSVRARVLLGRLGLGLHPIHPTDMHERETPRRMKPLSKPALLPRGPRRWGAHLCLGQVGGSERCPGSCQRMLEVRLRAGGYRSEGLPGPQPPPRWGGKPEVPALGTLRVLHRPAPGSPPRLVSPVPP